MQLSLEEIVLQIYSEVLHRTAGLEGMGGEDHRRRAARESRRSLTAGSLAGAYELAFRLHPKPAAAPEWKSMWAIKTSGQLGETIANYTAHVD